MCNCIWYYSRSVTVLYMYFKYLCFYQYNIKFTYNMHSRIINIRHVIKYWSYKHIEIRYRKTIAELVFYCSTVSAISFFFAHSGHIISSASVINPLPTIEALHEEQTKQLLCQCRPSKDINRVPPMPRLSYNC